MGDDSAGFASSEQCSGVCLKGRRHNSQSPFFPVHLCSDLKMGTVVAATPGTWSCGVSSGTSWSGVSLTGQGDVASLVCSTFSSAFGVMAALSRSSLP